MRLAWGAKARRDAETIVRFIAARDPAAAERIDRLIHSAVGLIVTHPKMYRPGRLPDTREAVIHPNYVIVYQVAKDSVVILAVLHARQNYP
jgi:toxin ParE1/3/4